MYCRMSNVLYVYVILFTMSTHKTKNLICVKVVSGKCENKKWMLYVCANHFKSEGKVFKRFLTTSGCVVVIASGARDAQYAEGWFQGFKSSTDTLFEWEIVLLFYLISKRDYSFSQEFKFTPKRKFSTCLCDAISLFLSLIITRLNYS